MYLFSRLYLFWWEIHLKNSNLDHFAKDISPSNVKKSVLKLKPGEGGWFGHLLRTANCGAVTVCIFRHESNFFQQSLQKLKSLSKIEFINLFYPKFFIISPTKTLKVYKITPIQIKVIISWEPKSFKTLRKSPKFTYIAKTRLKTGL